MYHIRKKKLSETDSSDEENELERAFSEGDRDNESVLGISCPRDLYILGHDVIMQ